MFKRLYFLLKVAPSELEDLIRQHEGVVEVAVTGIPDERAGELPRAYVIRKNRKVQEQDIIKFVSGPLFICTVLCVF